MYYMELTKHFTVLRDISDTVDEYLGRELYKEDFSMENEIVDAYYPKDILGMCYHIILCELRDMGVGIAMDEDDLLEDIYTCGYVYLVRKFVDRKYFVSLVKATETLEELDAYLTTDEIKPNLLQDLVDIINNKVHSYELNEMYYILESTYTNNTFTDYIKSLIEEIKNNPTDDTITDDTDAVAEYTKHINTLRHLAKKYSYMIIKRLHLEDSIDVPKLNKLLRDYDRDKLGGEVIGIYSQVDTEEDDLPLDKSILRKKYMDIHHKNSPHHPEYWLNQDNPAKQRFTLDNLVLLVAHHMEPGTTVEKFKSEVSETIAALAGVVLTPDLQQLASRMGDSIADCIESDPDLEEE